MAADNSPPRMLPIAITALVAVLVLFGLKFVFDSYYLAMFEGEEYRKVGSVAPTALIALHAAEKKSLATAPIPIDRAVDMVVKGRAEAMPELRDGGITPEPSKDIGPLIGWALTPRNVTVPDDDDVDAGAADAARQASPLPNGRPLEAVPSARPTAPVTPSSSPHAPPKHP